MDKGYLTFHRSPERHTYYLAGATHPIFDPVTKAWIITDRQCCERLLASPDTRPATYSDDYVALNKRLGIDFSNVLLAFFHIFQLLILTNTVDTVIPIKSSDSKLYKFDGAGNKSAEALLRETETKAGISVVVEVTIDGDMIKVTKITEKTQ